MAKRWVNLGDMPKMVRMSFAIDAEMHPELAAWIWNLPIGKGSAAIRQAMELGMKQVDLEVPAPLPPVASKKKRSFITQQPAIQAPQPAPAREPAQQFVEVPQPPHIEQPKPAAQPTTIKAEPQHDHAPELDLEQLAAMRQLGEMFDG